MYVYFASLMLISITEVFGELDSPLSICWHSLLIHYFLMSFTMCVYFSKMYMYVLFEAQIEDGFT